MMIVILITSTLFSFKEMSGYFKPERITGGFPDRKSSSGRFGRDVIKCRSNDSREGRKDEGAEK